MNPYSTLVGVLCLLAFVGPIAYLVYRQNAKAKRSVQNINARLAAHQFTTNEYSTIGHLVFAIDKTQKQAIIFKAEEPTTIHYCKDADNAIVIEKAYRKLPNGKQVIDNIKLFFETATNTITMCVYDETYPNHLEADGILHNLTVTVNQIKHL